jgi:PAS domain S-box-containing protein
VKLHSQAEGPPGASPTPRRRARAQPRALRSRHAREILHGSIEATSDLVAAHDLRGRYVAFNGAYRAEFARVFGVELELGDRVLDALADVPRDRTKVVELVQRALRGEAFTALEEFGDERRGRRSFEIRCVPLRNGRGRLIGAAHAVRDVTEKRRVEEALREANAMLEHRVAERTAALAQSEERLRTLVENFPGAIYMKDRENRMLLINRECAAIMGVDRSAALGKRHDELFADEALGRSLSENDRRVIEGGAAAVFEEVVDREGGPHTYLSVKVPLADPRGQIYGLFGICTDITDRKRAEDALKRSEAILAQAGEMAHLGAWWVDLADGDADRNSLHWSDEVFRIFGYAPGEVAVTNELFFARVPPEDHPRIREAVKTSMASRRPYHLEHRVLRPDGTERVVIEHAEVVLDERGRPVRLVGAVLDITERKRVEEALREADRRKNEFLGVLSHELRNPLAPVRNALWLLDHAGSGGTSAARAKEVLNRQVAHLSRIVDDLLDVTRITRGKIHLQKARIDVLELVRRTIEDHRTVFSEREVEVTARLAQLPIWIDADPTRVSQAIGNLLQNAAKFTDPGGHVAVTAERDAQLGAVVAVRDDGIGFAPALLGRMFEPFTQGDDSLHRTRGGLGLGLSLVKGLVELHGGSVEARSEGPGRGAEFVLRFPLAPEQPALAGEALPVGSAMSARRVLVIEDNADAAETLREMLEMWGHEVAVASDGRAGVAKARSFAPDVVLCDIGLPEMDGYEVARAIRADPEIAATFLVAVTGYALPEDQRRAAEAGFMRHLGKPVPIEVMEQVLATAPRLGR